MKQTMYKVRGFGGTTLKINEATEGESIENRIERMVNNEEGIVAEAPIIHTERKEGVRPEFDIRTDKWELANEAADLVTQNSLLRKGGLTTKEQDEWTKKQEKAAKKLSEEATKNEAKGQPTAGTDNEK